MATWVVHLRIADYFLNKLNVSESEFVVGNVAPDCGYGIKDSDGEFIPPPKVTHWSPSGMKRDCRYKDFSRQYLLGKDKEEESYSFYLGYYIHLLTDIMWSRTIYFPVITRYSEEFEKNPGFLKVIKRDWNDLDFKYLNENPDLRAYAILEKNKQVEDYLPYYEPGQLTVQSRFVADFYKAGMKNRDFEREYQYLTSETVTDFIKCACELIEMDLKKKNLAQFKNKA